MAEPAGSNNPENLAEPPACREASGLRLNRGVGAFGIVGAAFMVLEKLGTFSEGWEGIEKLAKFFETMPPWVWWILAAGFVLVALWSLYLEARRLQDQRAARRLAAAGGEPRPGYFRIGPYLDRTEDREAFRRADQAHIEVLRWLESAQAVPLYLTGDSGTGKSSLLNAYVLPELKGRGWTIFSARAYQDPEESLREALAAGRARRPEYGRTLRDLAESAARKSPVLLLLDQFEEFLILAAPEVRIRFADLVKDLADRPVKNLRLLLALRSDYQRELGKAGLPLPHYGRNLYEVGRFDFAAARGFMAGSGLRLDGAAAEKLLDSAAVLDDTRGRIRPITLNVLGRILEEGRHPPSGLDAARLVRGYLGQTVEQPAVREFARPVLEQLLTEQGTKRPKTQAGIATATGLEPYAVLAVLNGLGKAGLARPLDDAPGGVWELSHDFVARALNAYLGRRPGELYRTVLAYAGPALLGALLAALGVYEAAVAGPERARRAPILPQMVDIPAGSFCMGSHKADSEMPVECRDVPKDPESLPSEKPVRWVKIGKPFRLGKYEVTMAEYERFALDTGRSPPGDSGFGAGLKPEQRLRLPVINVSFEDAEAYAAWLSARTGLRFRLPSEAEWEYAARAGTVTRFYWGDDPEHREGCAYANVLDRRALPSLKNKGYAITWEGFDCDAPDVFEYTAPAGSFRPNAWGLHDMPGNVWEWVADCWHDSYRGAPAGQEAWTDGTDCASGRRVIRGGSWDSRPANLRSAYRNRDNPGHRYNFLGFRLAQDQ